MFSVSEIALCIYDHVRESCVGGDTTNNDQEFINAQGAYEENGDQDDDDIYDYAPAAWVYHMPR